MSQKETENSKPKWTWHFYRPETIMVYLAALLGLYYWLQGSPELFVFRDFPLDDGTALMLGQDVREGPNGDLLVWRTGLDEPYEWLGKLEGNFVPAREKQQQLPVCAAGKGYAFILSGQKTSFDERLTTLSAVNLKSGNVEWHNSESPTGDASFQSVFFWGKSLVTCHVAQREEGKSKIYLVGRALSGGGMIWTTVLNGFSIGKNLKLAQQVQYLPGTILVANDSLHLIDCQNGQARHTWAGQVPVFRGGWLYYQNAEGLRILDTRTLSDSLLVADEAAFEPEAGYAGFYKGFPVHINSQTGWRSFQPGRKSPNWLSANFCATAYPNGQYGQSLHNQNLFLSQDWTRYVPAFIEPNAHDSLKKYIPEQVNGLDLSGTHFCFFDLVEQNISHLSKKLAPNLCSGTLLSAGKYHYFIAESGPRPLVIQFDGHAGRLSKAVRSTCDFQARLRPSLHQPVGQRIWLQGGGSWASLDADNLKLSFASNDSIRFEDVTSEIADRYGFK